MHVDMYVRGLDTSDSARIHAAIVLKGIHTDKGIPSMMTHNITTLNMVDSIRLMDGA